MITRILIFVVGLIFLNSNVRGQEIVVLQQRIDSLNIKEDFRKMAEIAEKQKRLVDLQYYELLFKTYKDNEDKLTRILAFKQIRNLQYFLYKGDLYDKSINLYIEATKKLILEYKDDVALLNSINVTPSVRLKIYPILKRAIEKSGGKWERGEIPARPLGGVPYKNNSSQKTDGPEY